MAVAQHLPQNEQPSSLLRKRKPVESSSFSLPTLDVPTPQRAGSDPGTARPITPAVRQYIIQTKLMVGPTNDAYEREADRLAEQVAGQSSPAQAPAIQRLESSEEDEELQLKSDGSRPQSLGRQGLQRASAAGGAQGGALEPEMEQTLQRARGQGQPLDTATRAKMEHGFGADFSRVKVHADKKADTLNRSLHARAFTTGQDIFFRKNEYNPTVNAGQKLLAHELTHVVQQSGPKVQRAASRAQTSPPTIQREWNWDDFKQRRKAGWATFKQNRKDGWDTFKQNRKDSWDSFKNTPRARNARRRNAGPDPDPLDFGTGTTATGLVENVTGISGLFGTAGASNFGTSDVGLTGTTAGDWMQQRFANQTSDTTSGVSDAVGGSFGTVGNVLGAAEAISILRNPNASRGEKAQAALTLSSNVFGAGSNVAKVVGGIGTAENGAGRGWGGSSMFDNSVSGVSKTTDIKYVGDVIGLGASSLGLASGTVGAARDFSKWKKDIHSGKFASKEKGGRGGGAFARSFGRGAKSLTGIASSGASLAKTSALLAGQIQGGGQVASNFASTAAGTAATTAGLVGGGLGVATGAMDMMSGGFKMWKAHKRKGKIEALRNQGFGQQVSAQDQQDALDHLKEIQAKKSREGKYGLATGAVGIAAGALTLSGVGAIGGAALGAGVGAFKLGRWGFNKIRQARRDATDKKEKQIRADLVTAGVQLTDQQWEAYLDAKDQRLAARAEQGGLKGVKGKIAEKFRADRNKSTANKDTRYTKTASTLLAMHTANPDGHILRGLLSISDNQLNGVRNVPDDQIKMIMQALKKR